MEKEMATYSSTLAWKNSMDRRAGQAAVHGLPELDMIVQLSHTTYT